MKGRHSPSRGEGATRSSSIEAHIGGAPSTADVLGPGRPWYTLQRRNPSPAEAGCPNCRHQTSALAPGMLAGVSKGPGEARSSP